MAALAAMTTTTTTAMAVVGALIQQSTKIGSRRATTAMATETAMAMVTAMVMVMATVADDHDGVNGRGFGCCGGQG